MKYSLNLLEAIGLVGTIMILGAFGMNSFGIVSSASKIYQSMNLVGAIAFIYYTYRKTAWQSLIVNSVWLVISVIALYRIFFHS